MNNKMQVILLKLQCLYNHPGSSFLIEILYKLKLPSMVDFDRFRLVHPLFNIISKSSVFTTFLERFTCCHKDLSWVIFLILLDNELMSSFGSEELKTFRISSLDRSVLLKEPGPSLIWEGGPVCFSRFYWRFLAKKLKILWKPNWNWNSVLTSFSRIFVFILTLQPDLT